MGVDAKEFRGHPAAMKCLVCPDKELVERDLETALRSFSCDKCGGRWISSYQYWQWLHLRGAAPVPTPGAKAPVPVVHEPDKSKICPECGRILTKYKVGHGLDFHLHRCGTCAGIWFDKDEWEILKARGLAGDVDAIFTAAWQTQVRREELTKAALKTLSEHLGVEGFARAEEFKRWVQAHPRKGEILAFLADASD